MRSTLKYGMVIFATISAMFSVSAMAQEYPSQPIKIIVPAGAGGGTDVLVRTIQPYLEEELGAEIVVINVPGSGSVAGSRRVKDAEPDGYTILVNHTTLLTAMATEKADFGLEDFIVSAIAIEVPLVVVVPDESPVDNLADLWTLAKTPDRPLIAGVNLGAVNHFSLLMVEDAFDDVAFRYVQTGGGAKTSAALLGNRIDVGVLAGSEAKSLFESGDIKIIAALTESRIPYLPDVATAVEQDVNAVLGAKYSWFMPAGTADDRVEVFSKGLRDVLENTPELRSTFEERGFILTLMSGPDATVQNSALMSRLNDIAATLQ